MISAKTMRCTVQCVYCGTPLTYKSYENKLKSNRHIHKVCLKVEKDELIKGEDAE